MNTLQLSKPYILYLTTIESINAITAYKRSYQWESSYILYHCHSTFGSAER